jgi:hypothetical protein
MSLRVPDPSWMTWTDAVPQGTLAGRPRNLCLADERIPKALWSGRTGRTGCLATSVSAGRGLGPADGWACSPHRRSSRQVSRQTSGPYSSPYDRSGAASRRHRAPHPNLAPTPLPGGRLARRVKQRSAAYGLILCRHGPPPGAYPKSVRAVDPSIEPSSDWHHCHRRTGQRPRRPAVSDRLVGRCQSEGRAASAGQRLWPRATSAHWRGQDRRESGCSGWFAATRAGYSATARQQAGLM